MVSSLELETTILNFKRGFNTITLVNVSLKKCFPLSEQDTRKGTLLGPFHSVRSKGFTYLVLLFVLPTPFSFPIVPRSLRLWSVKSSRDPGLSS